MPDLCIVLWAWKPRGRRTHKGLITYGPALANMQAKAIRAHLSIPHEIVCVTDHPAHEFSSDIRVVDADEHFGEHADMGGCYRRLKMYAPEAREILGDRIVSMDLDMVVAKDLTPLFRPWYDFRIWRSESVQGTPYNGSLQATTAGANAHIWKDFDPEKTPALARMQGYRGTDQSVLALMMGRDAPVWTWQDGVFYLARNCPRDRVPELARVIFSPGSQKVTDPAVQHKYPWLRDLLERDTPPGDLPKWTLSPWSEPKPGEKPRYYKPSWKRMQEVRQEMRRQERTARR